MSVAATEQEIHELFPWFMLGMLDEKEAESFRAHLAQCDWCKAEIEFIEGAKRQMGEHGDVLLEDHPSPDSLVATVRGEMDGEKAKSVRRHLALCPDCALEARWARDEAVVVKPHAPSPVQAWWSRPIWGWGVALAASLALIAVIPRIGRQPSLSGLVHPVVVQGAARGSEAAGRVELDPNSRVLELIVPADLPPAAFPVTVEVLSGSRSVLLETNVAEDSLRDGYLFLILDPREYEPGDYTIRVQGTEGSGHDLRFKLQLVGAGQR